MEGIIVMLSATQIRICFASVAVLVMVLCGCAQGSDGPGSGRTGNLDQLRKGFLSPGADFRVLPMDFETGKIPEYADKFVEGGWGGAHFNYPHGGPDYLQDEAGWSSLAAAVQTCKARGLNVWIYDEAGYPSGRAGGLVLKDHPELESQGLFYDSLDVITKAPKQVEWQLPEGKPFYVAMCPLYITGSIGAGEITDLTPQVKDGVLHIEVQPGEWRIMAFVQNRLYEGTHGPLTFGPYINIIDPEAVRRFIDITYESFYAHCGSEFGKTIKAFFTDEPSLMNGYLAHERQKHPVLPWYHGLPDLFSARHGYDIRQALPALFNDIGDETPVKRCDFYGTISQAVADSYFKQIAKWCEAHNVAMTGHLLWEESLVYHAYFYGSIFPSLAEMDWPGIDVLGCNYGCTSGANTEGGPVTPKLISSVAHLYGKKRTASESFCFVKGTTPIQDLLAHINWQWVLGINSLTTLSINDQYPAEQFRQLNEYTGRLSYLLTQGKPVVNVAVLYPIASVWTEFVPANGHVSVRGDNPKAWDVNESWQLASREILASRRDFDYVDETILEKARISAGKLRFGTNSYSVLVLPHVTTLRYSALKQIEKFVKSGGAVISFETVPSIREDSGAAEDSQKIANNLWGNVVKLRGGVVHAETAAQLRAALDACSKPDVLISPDTREVYCQRRTLPNADIRFLVNNSREAVSGRFRFSEAGRTEIWNPMNGKMMPALPNKDGSVELTIPGRNGLFVLSERKSPK